MAKLFGFGKKTDKGTSHISNLSSLTRENSIQGFYFVLELMKENDRALRKVGRDLDRERNHLDREEKKLVRVIKILIPVWRGSLICW